jgi:hypothetical protein
MKKYTYRLLSLLFIAGNPMLNALPTHESAVENSKATANHSPYTSAINYGGYILNDVYNWRKPNLSLPNFDQLNVATFIPVGPSDQADTSRDEVLQILKQKNNVHGNIIIKGIEYSVQSEIPDALKTEQTPIFVYSGGYSNDGKPYAFCGYNAIKSGLVLNKICVTFEFATDTRRGFNFCQQQDVHCVKTVCNKIVEINPDAKIVLHGGCKGATNNLQFLAEQAEADQKAPCFNNIKAVLAESPPISVTTALRNTPLASVTLLLMRGIFPNYNPYAKTIVNATKFPQIPVMIGALPEDTISELKDAHAIRNHLTVNCNGNVQLFISQESEIRHGQIGKANDYKAAAQEFLKNSLKSQ